MKVQVSGQHRVRPPYIYIDSKEGIDISSLIDNYTKEELESIIASSFSYAEVLSRLGYSTKSGNNNKTLKNRIEYYNISTSHFTYKKPKTDWTHEEIFCENSKVSQNKLRKTVKDEEIFPYKCAICGLEPFWNEKPLVLTLDHKNGNNKDNRIENLQWICPNCDRQSDTYGYKNKKDLQKGTILFYINDETSNDNNMQRSTKQKKNIKLTDIYKPKREELKLKLWELKNYTQVGNYYNVSPTTIRRWCREYDLPATINILKHTSEHGWLSENWNDFYLPKNLTQQPIPCYMINKDTDEIIQEFPSRKAAARYLGIQSKNVDAHIGSVCAGNRITAYGYKWKNKE